MTVISDTIPGPKGSWVYRILVNSQVVMTSGGFQLRRDAEACGAAIAFDTDLCASL